MRAERQQGIGEQLDLFDEALKATMRHGDPGLGRSEARPCEEPQTDTAWQRERALTRGLMEQIASSANLNQAYKRVKANRGAPGVDGMTVDDLRPWIASNKDTLLTALLDGSYQPQPVRGVEIPKPGGGKRQLGIPTVVDRLVQQAILQVLEPLLDPSFSASSFGFRPGRGAHEALLRARDYVADGYDVVVDLDLEKFFRPGQPRCLDVPPGAAHWRQTPAADYPPLSGGGNDAVRRQHRATRGHAARRSAVAAALQSAAG